MAGATKAKEVGYVPSPDFEEDNKESLIDIEMNEDTELWFIQFADDQLPDFDGQKVSLELDSDGRLGSVEDKSGKVYHLLNYPAQTSDITVFLSSPSGPKVAGKISRHVSLVRYPDPKEVLAYEKKAVATSTNTSHQIATPSSSHKTSHSQSKSQSNRSSKRSFQSGVTDVSGHSKRSNSKTSRLSNQSTQDMGRGRSDVTISGSSELSKRKKSSKTNSEA
ncbi:mediator-associated protein 2 [Amaranthus tricolor]|uniref:mediator-associated protein 2 n=1 Tax=Amaranthus tricolor TaxID=29722 RepID=UPI00258D5E6F|nr:mediator-associated protein 2 [Amaranthus tricolor]